MIGYLRGEILDQSEGKLLVLQGTAHSGVGYSVSVPSRSEYSCLLRRQSCELFIHTHVREDALDLYGFLSKAEKELFLTLLSVTGIGPRGALSILSGAAPEQLIGAILQGDKDFLTSIPGIGKKTAERVILELTDSLKKKMEVGTGEKYAPAAFAKKDAVFFGDARSALLGLGYRENDVNLLLKKIVSESEMPFHKAEDLVREALRQLV